MTHTLRALFIPADPFEVMKEIDIDPTGTLKALQEAVDGLFQPILLRKPAADMNVNEEGLIFDLPVNERATYIAIGHAGITASETIRGDVLVTGTPDEDGNITSLDPLQMHLLYDVIFGPDTLFGGDWDED